MSARRGLSLLEVLLACALLGLLIQLFAMILVPMARASARSADRTELRNMVATALDKLLGDLDRGAPESIFVRATPLAVSVQSLEGLTSDGRAAWASELVVYLHDAVSRRLRRRAWPPEPPALGWVPGPSRAARVKPAELAQLAAFEGGTTLASWVKSCQVRVEGALVTARLEVEREPFDYALAVSRTLHNR